MNCRGCASPNGERVLDIGDAPPGDRFPRVDAPVPDPRYPLAMWQCHECALAQLVADAPGEGETPVVEPKALIDQAAHALRLLVDQDVCTPGEWVDEYPSPHGGSWLTPAIGLGLRPVPGTVDVLLDSFGVMHEADQRAAFTERAQRLRPGGRLILQVQDLGDIVRQHEWNALRHGHFAYYSLTSLTSLAHAAGLIITDAWRFELYGGVFVVVMRRSCDQPEVSATVPALMDAERALGVMPHQVASLQRAVDAQTSALRTLLTTERDAGRRVAAYGAASRAVALLAAAGIDRSLLSNVADASPAKQGCRMPGTDIPIITPHDLVADLPDRVLLLLPDLLDEITAHYPQLDGRWLHLPTTTGRAS